MPAHLSLTPSLIAASPLDVRQAVQVAEEAGATSLHIDIMDGHFVPNITYGPDLVKALRPVTERFLDVHLMVKYPETWIPLFQKAGADALTIHLEATPQWPELLVKIKQAGCQAGLAINPQTDLGLIPADQLNLLDRLLIMTVEPGFSGQNFMPLWDKIHQAALLKLKYPHLVITVDGGVQADNIGMLARSGIDFAVVGSAFYHQSHPIDAWRNLQQKMTEAAA